MDYLLIENKGTADIAAYTTLGISTTRHADRHETIGRFGSGTKHGIAVCIRHGVEPIIMVGDTKLCFFGVEEEIRSINDTHKYNRIKFYTDSPSDSELHDCGFVAEFGTMDWQQFGMAIREFVSNAIDASLAISADMSNVSVRLVDKSEVGRKEGYTRVYIQAIPEVEQYYNNLHHHFLHFSRANCYDDEVMPKSEPGPAKLYRRGVFIGESTHNSLFNYNFRDVELTESRNIQPNAADGAAALALLNADEECISAFLASLVSKDDGNFWEHTFGSYDLKVWESKYYPDELKQRWRDAWGKQFGEDAVITPEFKAAVKAVTKAGYTPIHLQKSYCRDMFSTLGIPTHKLVTTQLESEGIITSQPTALVREILETVWQYIGLDGYDMPEILLYHKEDDTRDNTLSFYSDDTIHLSVVLGSDKVLIRREIIARVLEHMSATREETSEIIGGLIDRVVSVVAANV